MFTERTDHHQTGQTSSFVAPTSRFGCPACGASETAILPRRQRPDDFMVLPPRRCTQCGAIYIPSAGPIRRWVAVGFTFVASIGIYWGYVAPGLASLFRGERPHASGMYLLLGLFSIGYFARIAYIALRSGRARALWVAEEEEERASGS